MRRPSPTLIDSLLLDARELLAEGGQSRLLDGSDVSVVNVNDLQRAGVEQHDGPLDDFLRIPLGLARRAIVARRLEICSTQLDWCNSKPHERTHHSQVVKWAVGAKSA